MAAPRSQDQYGMEDLLKALFDLFLKGGDPWSNSTLGQPDRSSAYDVIASSQRKMALDAVRGNRIPITYNSTNSRHQAMMAILGEENAVKNVLDFTNEWFPELSETLTGQYGASQGSANIVNSAIPMAIARGGRAGGLVDQLTMQRNIYAASREGGAVYSQLFRPDGTVDTDVTYGLSLPEMGKVIGSILSDKNIRKDWAKNAAANDQVKAQEAEDLVNGTRQTDEALKSFAKYTKTMVTEMSRLVASANKVTGDYDKTVGFLQRLTDGELFKTGEKAQKARDRASTLTTNMRLAAAEAGMSGEEMFMKAEYFTKGATRALGMGDSEDIRGGRAPFSYLGGFASIANANWRKMNPNASKEQQTYAEMAIADSVTGYVASAQDQMNALAAKLASRGMNMSEYEANLMTGDAEKSKQILMKMVGRDKFTDYMNSPGLAWLDRKTYNDQYTKYAGISVGAGRTEDTMRTGGERMLSNLFSDVSGMLATGIGEDKNAKVLDMETEMWNSYRDQLVSAENLKAGGMSDAQIAIFQKWAEGKDATQISEKLNSSYGAVAGDMIRHKASRGLLADFRQRIEDKVMSGEEEKDALSALMGDSELQGLLGDNFEDFRKKAEGKSFSEVSKILSGYMPGQENKAQEILLRASNGKISGDRKKMLEGIERNMNIISPELDLERARMDLAVAKKNDELKGDIANALGSEANVGMLLDRAAKGEEFTFSGDEYLTELAKQLGIDTTSEEGKKKLDEAKSAYATELGKDKGTVNSAERAFAGNRYIDPEMRKKAMQAVLDKHKNKDGKIDWAAVGASLSTSVTATRSGVSEESKNNITDESAFIQAQQNARSENQSGTAEKGGNAADPTKINDVVEVANKFGISPKSWANLTPGEQAYLKKVAQYGDLKTAEDRNKTVLELSKPVKDVLEQAQAAGDKKGADNKALVKLMGSTSSLEDLKKDESYKDLEKKYSTEALDAAIKKGKEAKDDNARGDIAEAAIQASYIQKHMGSDGSLEGSVIKILNSIYMLLLNNVKANGGA